MDRKLRRCSVCGTEYRYCAKSTEDKHKETWYFAFGSQNCHDIYEVTSKYENGHITANEAKEKLDKLDLSKLDKFGSSYKKTIESINASATTSIVLTVDTDVTETIIEDELIAEKATEEVENEETTDVVKEKVKKSKKTKRVE